MKLQSIVKNLVENPELLDDAKRMHNVSVLASLLGPAFRGLVLKKGKSGDITPVATKCTATFNWKYGHDQLELAKLYEAAKNSQWNATTALDWKTDVDPHNEEKELLMDEVIPIRDIPAYRRLSKKEKAKQRQAYLAWTLSQFLHGEQGALFAACQVTQSVEWADAKLYGSTQVVDEGRHVEVFHHYLSEKLGRVYQINDNLYVVIDALMSDSRWDIKFLGMQIMVEGLALGAFGTLRESTREPLLRDLLKYVITDEGRHVHYGVVALRKYYTTELSPKELKDREDWAFEVSVLLRNRFLAHEFYDEYYAHLMSRKTWNQLISESQYMQLFRNKMFKRLIPNLKKINLLSNRIRPYYEQMGLLEWESGKAAPEITTSELLGDEKAV